MSEVAFDNQNSHRAEWQMAALDCNNPLAGELAACPTPGILERIQKWEAEFEAEFLKTMQGWQQEGRLDEQTVQRAINSLTDDEARTYFSLWLKLNGFNFFFNTLLIDGIAVSEGGVLRGVLVELARGAIRNLIVQIRGWSLPTLTRQTLALWSCPPVIGSHAPLYFLFQKHPELTRSLYAYLRNSRLRKLIEKKKEDTPFSFWEKIYMKHIAKCEPDDLESFERGRFEKMFQMPWIEKISEAKKRVGDYCRAKIQRALK